MDDPLSPLNAKGYSIGVLPLCRGVSTRAFASDFPENAARLPPYAGRSTVRPPRCPLRSEPCGTAGTHLVPSKRQAPLTQLHSVTFQKA